MNQFKIGDRVRRINSPWNKFPVNHIGIIHWIGSSSLNLTSDVNITMDIKNFELVELKPEVINNYSIY